MASSHSGLIRGIQGFAGILLIIGGAFDVIQSIAALFNDQYLIVLRNYVFSVDLTAWGWIHLLIGLALVVVGISLLMGQTWARIAGIVLASISAVINFSWLPYSPWWAILVISIDVLIIWALASGGHRSAQYDAADSAGARTKV